LCGIKGGIGAQMYGFRKAEVYVNAGTWQMFAEKTALPSTRPGLLAHTPPDKAAEILAAPLGVFAFVKMHLTILLRGYGPFKFFRLAHDYLDNRVAEANGRSPQELAAMSDAELIRELEHVAHLKTQFSVDLWPGFFVYARDSVSLLAALLAKWYDGGNSNVFADLFSGLPRRTATSEENLHLWRLSERIRHSPRLRAAFDSAGVNYLQAFEAFDEGRAFVADYHAFAAANAFRGHADRDPYYPRRGDDPAIDYGNFRTLLAAQNSVDPEERERQVNDRRNAAIADVESNLRLKPFGRLRCWAFRKLLDYAHDFFFVRDNQRHYFDRYTYAVRRIALEMGGRLVQRGVLEEPMDAILLGRQELYRVLEGDLSDPLLAHKLAARKRDFRRMLDKSAHPPLYLRRGRPVSFAQEGDAAGLQGVGTARGLVTARARVVSELRNIGQVQQGDILITHSTDPGWTPVFNLISGIVLETGGMLAHGSCLAREYGLPAVQLAGATHTIPDGATITVNGDTGEVTLHDPERSAAA
jgi:pyruvate,water dikinase